MKADRVHFNDSAPGIPTLYVGATECGRADRGYLQSRLPWRVTCKTCLRLLQKNAELREMCDAMDVANEPDTRTNR